jgi:hypothetical protein
MMTLVAALFFFLAQPFWDSKPPERWSDLEVEEILHNSPWARTIGPEPAVEVFLASAKPVEDAETEARLHHKKPLAELDPDYASYISENRDRMFVLAIRYSMLPAAAKASEERNMEEQSEMLIGKKKYRIAGHFPPIPSDPVLRLVFPRVFRPGDKRVVFRLYVPYVNFPEREIEFYEKDLLYHGKLEY